MVGVQQWAEIRRLVLVEGCSQREVAARLGLARDTVARAVRLETPPKYSRVRAGSKLDPFREWDGEQLRADPRIPAQRLREMAGELGYVGGKTIFDDYVREVRPRFVRPRTFQRTIYRPGELVQCDLWERCLSLTLPCLHTQTRLVRVVVTRRRSQPNPQGVRTVAKRLVTPKGEGTAVASSMFTGLEPSRRVAEQARGPRAFAGYSAAGLGGGLAHTLIRTSMRRWLGLAL